MQFIRSSQIKKTSSVAQMVRTFVLLTVLMTGWGTAALQAQEDAPKGKGKINWERTEYDFGKIREDGGAVTVFFKFTNTGDAPLKLTSVKASCGCTTPTWTQAPIAPGKMGYVKAEFNPLNRPGLFHKIIAVECNGDPRSTQLMLNGTVLPREKGPKDWYPFEEGNLRFKTNHMAFGHLNMPTKDTLSTILYNQGKKPIRLFPERSEIPAHVKLKLSGKSVPPGGKVRMWVQYDTYMRNDYGFLFEYFLLVTDDEIRPHKRINLSADVHEDFSDLSSGEKATAPRLSLNKTVHKFGNVVQGEKVEATFQVTNSGKSELLLRKVKAACTCTLAKPGKKKLAAGESTEITVRFNSSGRQGPQDKSITLISNDPSRPEITLRVMGNVLIPEE